jgi:hypothetical protein
MERALREKADTAWASELGCTVSEVRTPGVRLVPGGPGFEGRVGLYMARIDDAVLVYGPESWRDRLADRLGQLSPDEAFTPAICSRLAEPNVVTVPGLSLHAFVDARHLTPAGDLGGVTSLDSGDQRLHELRRACGEAEWAEGGFGSGGAVLYGCTEDQTLVAAGNLTPLMGSPADIGLVTHPTTGVGVLPLAWHRS